MGYKKVDRIPGNLYPENLKALRLVSVKPVLLPRELELK